MIEKSQYDLLVNNPKFTEPWQPALSMKRIIDQKLDITPDMYRNLKEMDIEASSFMTSCMLTFFTRIYIDNQIIYEDTNLKTNSKIYYKEFHPLMNYMDATNIDDMNYFVFCQRFKQMIILLQDKNNSVSLDDLLSS